MFCPNGHGKFVIGPEYIAGRSVALMTCLQCGSRFDAYTSYGSGNAQSAARKAA